MYLVVRVALNDILVALLGRNTATNPDWIYLH